MLDPETAYALRRSSQEVHRALLSHVPEAEDAHYALCVQYSARALNLFAEERMALDSFRRIAASLDA